MENGKNFPPDTIPCIEEEKRETGPPPEAPVPVPLTEAQRRFAAQYHALIYGFLLEKKLEIREYYDIAAIGYLHAVQRYFTEKSLHRYKRYDADVFAGVNRRTAAVFQFHSAVLCRLNKVGCQRYEGDYTRLKQKHAERRARRMAG